MKRFKLLIFAGYYVPHRGGYAESLHGLARRLVKKHHTVTVVTCHVDVEAPKEEEIDGVTVLRLPCWHLLGGTYPVFKPTLKTWRIWRRLICEKFDVISTQTRFFPTSFLGTFFALRTRIPNLHTERGAFHSVVKNPLIHFISHTIDHTLGSMVVRLAKINVGVSRAATHFLRHLHARNIHLVHNGVKIIPVLPDEDKKRLKKRLGFKPSETIILFVGRLVYAKGLQDILPLLPELMKTHPHLRLVVVGDGTHTRHLKKQVGQLHIGAQVSFVGQKEFSEVRRYLQATDIFVNPSHSEGLPRSVLEAAAAGLPIIASDVGGTEEIIEDGLSGLLVQPKDTAAFSHAFKSFLKSPKKAHQMGRAAQKHVHSAFDWDKIAQSYIDLLKQLV